MGPHVERIAADVGRTLCGISYDADVRGLQPFGSGHSGFTYAVDVGGNDPLILRLSPPDARIAGPADVGRQGRIMSALHAAGLPVPRVLAFSSAPAIDGRAFVLMERVIGVEWEDAVAQYGQRRVGVEVLRALRTIAEVAIEDTGIANEPVVTPSDELTRWSRLLTKAPDHLHARGRKLEAVLNRSTLPLDSASLVHGDFHLANLLFDRARVVAILDWEIAEIGHRYVDLGSLLVTALRHRYVPDPNVSGELGLTPAEIAKAYGAPPGPAAWFAALACLKYAAIIGYNFQLHRSGRRPDSMYERLQTTMRGLLDDGLTIAEAGLAAIPPPPSAGDDR